MDYDKIDDEQQWFHGLTFLTIIYRFSGLDNIFMFHQFVEC